MIMPFARIGGWCALALVVATPSLVAQELGTDFSRYRAFQLGSSLVAVSTGAGIPATDATLAHTRPARLQDLTWRLARWAEGSPTTDPVSQIRFSFYNDQLFRLVVEYAADRTQGMTDADLIDALSVSYGRPLIRSAGVASATPTPDLEGGTLVARWGNDRYGLIVYRPASYSAPMRLILTDVRLERLARQAQAESQRLDEQEAPTRELAREKKALEDSRAAAEKARETNKATFHP
jgi:hypothetical protein